MTQGSRQKHETSGKDRDMWKLYWRYKTFYRTKTPPVKVEDIRRYWKADSMMINDLFISNK